MADFDNPESIMDSLKLSKLLNLVFCLPLMNELPFVHLAVDLGDDD